MNAQLTAIDWLIMGVYFVFVLGVCFALRRALEGAHRAVALKALPL